MKTTHYEINGHSAIICDPASTAEQRRVRENRWKNAAVRFCKAVEKEGVKDVF